MAEQEEHEEMLRRVSGRTRRSVSMWTEFALAYKKAADLLASTSEAVGADGYPTAFLYRHFLELQLKSILAGALLVAGLDQPRDERCKLLTSHDLLGLLSAIQETLANLRQFPPLSSYEQYKTLDSLVHDFDRFDPNSYSFRYPVDKRATPGLPHFGHVEVRRLQQRVGKVTPMLFEIYRRVAHSVFVTCDWPEMKRDVGFVWPDVV